MFSTFCFEITPFETWFLLKIRELTKSHQIALQSIGYAGQDVMVISGSCSSVTLEMTLNIVKGFLPPLISCCSDGKAAGIGPGHLSVMSTVSLLESFWIDKSRFRSLPTMFRSALWTWGLKTNKTEHIKPNNQQNT